MCATESIPGSLERNNVPQMVVFAFTGPLNNDSWYQLRRIFDNEGKGSKERVNPNGERITMTLFASDKSTDDYCRAGEFYRDGHEIGVTGSYSMASLKPSKWEKEIMYHKKNLTKKANIDKHDIHGMRAPELEFGGDRQFQAINAMSNITRYKKHAWRNPYDSSIVLGERTYWKNTWPSWPYTLDYRVYDTVRPHNVHPAACYPGMWEIPVQRFYENYSTAHFFIDDWVGAYNVEMLYYTIVNNFWRHYSNNRAPFIINARTDWFKRDLMAEKAVERFIDVLLAHKSKDVYMVSMDQMLEWVKNPVPLDKVKESNLLKRPTGRKGAKCNFGKRTVNGGGNGTVDGGGNGTVNGGWNGTVNGGGNGTVDGGGNGTVDGGGNGTVNGGGNGTVDGGGNGTANGGGNGTVDGGGKGTVGGGGNEEVNGGGNGTVDGGGNWTVNGGGNGTVNGGGNGTVNGGGNGTVDGGGNGTVNGGGNGTVNGGGNEEVNEGGNGTVNGGGNGTVNGGGNGTVNGGGNGTVNGGGNGTVNGGGNGTVNGGGNGTVNGGGNEDVNGGGNGTMNGGGNWTVNGGGNGTVNGGGNGTVNGGGNGTVNGGENGTVNGGGNGTVNGGGNGTVDGGGNGTVNGGENGTVNGGGNGIMNGGGRRAGNITLLICGVLLIVLISKDRAD